MAFRVDTSRSHGDGGDMRTKRQKATGGRVDTSGEGGSSFNSGSGCHSAGIVGGGFSDDDHFAVMTVTEQNSLLVEGALAADSGSICLADLASLLKCGDEAHDFLS